MLQKFSTQKPESEKMREALRLLYDREDIPSFLSRSDKANNQAKVGESVKFELLRDALKSDQIFSSLYCGEDPKTIDAWRKRVLHTPKTY